MNRSARRGDGHLPRSDSPTLLLPRYSHEAAFLPSLDLLPWRHLDDLTKIHNRDTVRHVLDDREIMTDEEQRQAKFPLQILKQIHDLRLDGDVERRDRLVADDQVRLRRERPCDADALALSALEFVRPSVQRITRQVHGVHQRGDFRIKLRGRFGEAEIADRLGQNIAHAQPRTKARERVLKYHLHASADRTQPVG